MGGGSGGVPREGHTRDPPQWSRVRGEDRSGSLTDPWAACGVSLEIDNREQLGATSCDSDAAPASAGRWYGWSPPAQDTGWNTPGITPATDVAWPRQGRLRRQVGT
jgi:hypothetical protein